MKLTVVIAAGLALTSAVAVCGAMFAYEHFFTSTEVAALVPLALMVAILAPCLMWVLFAWLANRFSGRGLATVTIILGLLVCVLGCILIVKSTTGRGIDGQGIDAWWPIHVVSVSGFQCITIGLPLGWIWIVVGLDALDSQSRVVAK